MKILMNLGEKKNNGQMCEIKWVGEGVSFTVFVTL